MGLRGLRLIALVLSALTMGMTFAHTLELPPKREWAAEQYLAVQTSLYRLFGTIGPAVEVGAIVAALALAYRVRRSPATFRPSAAGAAILLLSMVLWLLVVMPAAAQIAGWQGSGAIPADWERWRDQWQLGQAGAFAMHLLAFVALAWSSVGEAAAEENATATTVASRLNV